MNIIILTSIVIKIKIRRVKIMISIFEEKSKDISYNKYPNRKSIKRQIKFNVPIAESMNAVIEVFKNNNSGNNLKMDSNVLIEVAIKHYFEYLNSIGDEDKAIEQLKDDVIKGL